MKNILVTGGLGFIGSHTVVELQASGYRVIVVDDLSNSTVDVLENIEKISGIKPDFHQLDLRNKSDVQQLFATTSIDGIIHFAAFKAVGESVHKPLEYYENNIGSLVYILQEMVKHNIKNFIFSSSCTVYGQAETLPITELEKTKPALSPYGNTKQVGEEIIIDACNAHQLNAISLRYFNPIGAHDSIHIGELPLGVPQNLIPYITQTAIGLRDELSIFGNDYDTKDGTAVRDYIHVVDLAKAHIAALTRLVNKENTENYEYYNVGTGTGLSVLEIVESFERVTEQKLNYTIVERRKGDVTAAFADNTLVTSKLKWQPEKSLDDALRSAWEWQKKNT
ncbi:UDP-glucose 4-epimerase [Tenacibaculum litopenaei]|uniref:UDP-glucose 4-epimerase GalE n=1 Tax=Tenacibaculum litopenaei TaxID=396016 RepID=UPI003894BAA9